MNIDEVLAQLTTPDSERDIAKEFVEAMANFTPDDTTKLASAALATLAEAMLSAVFALDLAEIKDDDGNSYGIDEEGELNPALMKSIRAASIIAAIARDEDRDTPLTMSHTILRAMFSPEEKLALTKQALDNIRKGIHGE